MSKNPFTPTFGSVPPFMAGREQILSDIEGAFDNGPGDPNLSTIFTGARGTGKTALLTYLSQAALAHGWVSANVSAMPGMLEDIIERANEAAAEFVTQRNGARLKGITVGALGLDWEYKDAERGNWRSRMNALLKQLEKYDIGLLITIDEVSVDSEEMLQLASVYQHFVREGRKTALFMAGLPYKVSALLRDDSVSFLRRSQQHQLGRIPDFEIADALVKTVNGAGKVIEAPALEKAVDSIDGFPFMMQLVGYRVWNAAGEALTITEANVEAGAKLAQLEMRDRILETTYRELSEGDLKFLSAMLEDPSESRISELAKRMGVSSSYASQYKRRLLDQGVIGERGRGVVAFDIPAFREFLEEKLRA